MAGTKADRKRKKQQAKAQREEIRQQFRAGGPAPDLTDSRLDKAVRKAERELADQQKQERDAREQERISQARARAADMQTRLRAEEAALRERERTLKRELSPEEQQARQGFLQRLWQGAARTRDNLTGAIARLVLGKKEIDQDVLDGLEELLYSSDVGPETAERLLEGVKGRVQRKELADPALLTAALRDDVRRLMHRSHAPLDLSAHKPMVVLIVGVNGSGKTTTIGKLAAQQAAAGKKVLLAAGDTFRAAAAEQLAGWSRRVGCELVSKPAGADPSGVIYEAVERAKREGYDIIFCDTAGRLHTKVNLMEELKKIKRVIGKVIPDAPHETWLVLDANTGQNAIMQTRDFHQAVDVTGLIVTKLDGTARGGVVVGIVNEFDLPVRFIGIGEGVDDLQPFDPDIFADSLFAAGE